MVNRKYIVRYLVEQYYEGDASEAAGAAGFASHQVTSWIEGRSKPQTKNIGRLMHRTFAPEFMVIAEYKPIDASGRIQNQLKKILKGHEKASGLYAFYDSMANLIYIGKSDGNLLNECYQQILKGINGNVFPRGAEQPEKRIDVVRYVSAYYVQGSDHQDYAKHVESVILRISKPILNANIGRLKKVGK
jgi:hypothetical protein